jgi:Sulfotransferase domain
MNEGTVQHDGRQPGTAGNRWQSSVPSFFVIGPPRTGTSWLREVLRERATLPWPVKETRFFDSHFHRGFDWYLAHFERTAADRVWGEVAPTYFASAEARNRIARAIPEARVVCVFRNPVERVLSLYRLKRAYGLIPWDLEGALTYDPELIESGKYASHLQAWWQTLGENQILVTFHEDLSSQPQTFVDLVADFIKVPRCKLQTRHERQIHGSAGMTQPRHYHLTRSATRTADWLKAQHMGRVVMKAKKSPLIKVFLGGGRPFKEPGVGLRRKIAEIFRPEVDELEVMLNRDLSEWKSVAAGVWR